MIKLNLHQFGGHGSGDGNIGAEHNDGNKINKKEQPGSAGGLANTQGKTQKESSAKITSTSIGGQVSPNETYNLYSESGDKLTFLSTITGRQLYSNGFTYDKYNETWRDKNRKRVILRTAKRK